MAADMADVPRTRDWTLWNPSVNLCQHYTDGKIHVPYLRGGSEGDQDFPFNNIQLLVLSMNDAIATKGGGNRFFLWGDDVKAVGLDGPQVFVIYFLWRLVGDEISSCSR